MDVGIICPIAHLDAFAVRSNYHLVLAHMVERSAKYREFYKRMSDRGDYITLDNSSYEVGDDVYSPDQLIEFAMSVGAKEVMAPESAGDADSTMKKVMEFVRHFRSIKGNSMKVFATIHGSSLKDIIRCHNFFIGLADTIGLSFRLDPQPKTNFVRHPNTTVDLALSRVQTIHYLIPFMKSEVRYHLLGLLSPFELTFYSKFGLIKSNDTSSAFVHGFHGIDVSDWAFEKLDSKLDFYRKNINHHQMRLISENITTLKELAGSTYKYGEFGL